MCCRYSLCSVLGDITSKPKPFDPSGKDEACSHIIVGNQDGHFELKVGFVIVSCVEGLQPKDIILQDSFTAEIVTNFYHT